MKGSSETTTTSSPTPRRPLTGSRTSWSQSRRPVAGSRASTQPGVAEVGELLPRVCVQGEDFCTRFSVTASRPPLTAEQNHLARAIDDLEVRIARRRHGPGPARVARRRVEAPHLATIDQHDGVLHGELTPAQLRCHRNAPDRRAVGDAQRDHAVALADIHQLGGCRGGARRRDEAAARFELPAGLA